MKTFRAWLTKQKLLVFCPKISDFFSNTKKRSIWGSNEQSTYWILHKIAFSRKNNGLECKPRLDSRIKNVHVSKWDKNHVVNPRTRTSKHDINLEKAKNLKKWYFERLNMSYRTTLRLEGLPIDNSCRFSPNQRPVF